MFEPAGVGCAWTRWTVTRFPCTRTCVSIPGSTSSPLPQPELILNDWLCCRVEEAGVPELLHDDASCCWFAVHAPLPLVLLVPSRSSDQPSVTSWSCWCSAGKPWPGRAVPRSIDAETVAFACCRLSFGPPSSTRFPLR